MNPPDLPSGAHRLQGFSDAVFAFACTLLVVSLEVPKNYAELAAALRGFLSFGLAFAVLVYIWSVHHKLFRRYPLDDSWTVLLNSCLLFVVLLFVYPLKFLAIGMASSLFGLGPDTDQGIHTEQQLANLYLAYGAAFAAVFVLVATLYQHAGALARRAGVLAGQQAAREPMRHYLLLAAVAGTSMLCAGLGLGLRAGLPGWVYFLIGPLAWINGVMARRRRRTQASSP